MIGTMVVAGALALSPAGGGVAWADTPPVVDAAQAAAARQVVDAVFPAGTYAKIMNGAMTGMMDRIGDQLGQMPLRQFAEMGGAPAETLAKLDKARIGDVMAILDPAYQERTQRIMRSLMPQLAAFMGQAEPGIRAALAAAYARQFTPAQLADMNRFFASPSGAAYAANAMTIQMSPEVMGKMQALMPAMMQAMPEMLKTAIATTADLPKPRKLSELSPAERAKLAGVLGVSAESLRGK